MRVGSFHWKKEMETVYISSRTNPTVKLLASLEKKKAREETGLYMAEGRKLCREALGNKKVKYAVVREDKAEGALMELCRESGGEILVLSESAYEKISSDQAPDGVAFVLETEDNEEEINTDERVVMLDSVRDPGNVGSIIRSAAALGYDRVVLCNCADIYNPKTVKSTMGAVFKMRFTVCSSCLGAVEQMKKNGRRVIAAALRDDALTLGESPLLKSDCLVIGNEGHGVSEELLSLCTNVIKIPMSGKTESLNASVAAAIIMWEQGKVL